MFAAAGSNNDRDAGPPDRGSAADRGYLWGSKPCHLAGLGFYACSPENTRISEILAATESALEERLSRAAKEGDLPEGMDARALARFVMALSEGHAVHAAAGASCEDLQASIDIALRAVALQS
ncbi:hypothetical protein ACWD6N_33230 [Micromonospora sp. NPDC005163]